MIAVRAPCPVCRKPVKVEKFHGQFTDSFVVGCFGIKHSMQLYGFTGPEAAAEAWDKLFLVSEVST